MHCPPNPLVKDGAKAGLFYKTMELHIPKLPADVIGHIQGLPITNTMVNAWLAILIFLALGIALKKSLSLRPGKLQNWAEYFLEIMLGYFDQVTGSRAKTLRFLPIVGAIFFFILLSNWLSLLPGTGSLLWRGEFLLRPANTDLNLTVAMALVSVISSHILGIFSIGFLAHAGKFVQLAAFLKSFRAGPMAVFTAFVSLFAGLVEIISEIAKVLSLSLRLFGNIFAGEVLLSVIFSLIGFLVPTPFMLLELLVGLIQAGVFAMLTLTYLTVQSEEPHGAEH